MIISVGIRMPIQIAISIPVPVNAKWSGIDGIDIFTWLLAIRTNIEKPALAFYEKIVYLSIPEKFFHYCLLYAYFWK